MIRRWHLVALGLALGLGQSASAGDKRPCDEFQELEMTLERNATDGDTEVVLFAQTVAEGLARLAIFDPGGKKVAKFEGDKRGVGLREFLLESAEPPDLDAVLASFPEGTYRFAGKGVTGTCVRGTAELSHEIAPETTLLSPASDAVVPIDALELAWAAVENAEEYVVELENEDTGSEFTFIVIPPTTSLVIPATLLVPDSEYQFGVGVKTESGNVTFVERTFVTAGS
jgi:hypothetical protein